MRPVALALALAGLTAAGCYGSSGGSGDGGAGDTGADDTDSASGSETDTDTETVTDWPDGGGDPMDAGSGDPCAEASARLGKRVCVHRVPDRDIWEGICVPGNASVLYSTKYLVPASPESLPTLFMDVNAFMLHFDLLAEAFPDSYPGLTPAEYNSLVLGPETRTLYAGTLTERLSSQGVVVVFSVLDDPADASTTVTVEEVDAVYRELGTRFSVGPLSFTPTTANQRAAVEGWDADFPIHVVE